MGKLWTRCGMQSATISRHISQLTSIIMAITLLGVKCMRTPMDSELFLMRGKRQWKIARNHTTDHSYSKWDGGISRHGSSQATRSYMKSLHTPLTWEVLRMPLETL